MGTAAMEETDYFELSALAARMLQTNPASLIRFEKVRLQLIAFGVRKGDERIPLWVAPILCTTPEARRAFFEEMPSRQPLPKEASNDSREEKGGDRSTARKDKDLKPFERKRPGLYAAMMLPIAAISLVPLDQPKTTVITDPVVIPDSNSAAPPPILPTPETDRPEQSRIASMLMAVAPLLAALVYVAWLRRRRRLIRRDRAPAPDISVKLSFATGVDQLFSDRSLRKALGNLRRHRAVASTKLNVPAAIKATIRSGGFPAMRYGFRPRSPDYLILHERESPADHLGLVARLIAKRMSEEHVAHSRYEYFGDPRRLQLIERDIPAGIFPLATVLARHDGARVMLLQESHDCFGEEKSPEWLARIVETERPVLVNPRPRESWGPAEGRLAALGMGIVAPSSGGFVDYADYLNTIGNVRRRLGQANAVRFDLPESLASDRDLLFSNEQPPDDVVAELVLDLNIWLDEGGAYWLRALALFPSIDPGFTVFVGKALSGPDDRELMDEARFIDLARLPWLRAGRMPNWLRGALVRGLTPNQLEAAINAIQAFLLPAEQPEDATSIDFARGGNRKLRKGLLDWLKLHPESILSDQLLIEALNGKPPDKLGIEAPKTLLQNSRRLWAGNEMGAVALGVAATLAVSIWQWPALYPGPPDDIQSNPPPPRETTQDEMDALNAADAALNAAAEAVENAAIAVESEADAVGNGAGASTDAGDPTQVEAPPRSTTIVRTPEPSKVQQSEVPDAGPGNWEAAGQFFIHFDWDSSALSPKAVANLQPAVQAYKEAASRGPRDSVAPVRVLVIGYTDTERSPEYSMALGQRMANSVADYLTKEGVPRQIITIESRGSTAAMAVLGPDVRDLQYRRVEVVIYSLREAPTAN